MTRYPSNRTLTDQIFFVTSGTKSRQPIFADPRAARVVVDSLQYFRAQNEILLFAFVIMPDHIHLILKVNTPLTVSALVKRLKTHVAHVLAHGPIWEHSFWSETIDTQHLFHQKLIYTHENPIRAGLVQAAEEYPWSSAQEYLCKPEVELVDWPY